MFTSLEHEEEPAHNFVANHYHGALVATPDHNSLELREEKIYVFSVG